MLDKTKALAAIAKTFRIASTPKWVFPDFSNLAVWVGAKCEPRPIACRFVDRNWEFLFVPIPLQGDIRLNVPEHIDPENTWLCAGLFYKLSLEEESPAVSWDDPLPPERSYDLKNAVLKGLPDNDLPLTLGNPPTPCPPVY